MDPKELWGALLGNWLLWWSLPKESMPDIPPWDLSNQACSTCGLWSSYSILMEMCFIGYWLHLSITELLRYFVHQLLTVLMCSFVVGETLGMLILGPTVAFFSWTKLTYKKDSSCSLLLQWVVVLDPKPSWMIVFAMTPFISIFKDTTCNLFWPRTAVASWMAVLCSRISLD